MLVDYWRFALSNPRFLGFGFFLAFMSSAGQTYFIGVFGAGIQADFGLDAGSWGRIYMIGTLASALVIAIWIYQWIVDQRGQVQTIPGWIRLAANVGMIMYVSMAVGRVDQPFIYFQF